MRKQTQNWTGWRSALAVAAGLGLAWGAQAALEGSLVDGLSYYSSFDNPDNGIAPEQGEGKWNTTTGGSPAFIAVTGNSQALNLASYNAWNSSNQTVLSTEAQAFTIVFRAKTGTAADGILFAFGTSTGGGLAIRRDGDSNTEDETDDAVGKWAIITGTNSERILYTPVEGAYDGSYNTLALTYDAANTEAPLALYHVLADGSVHAAGTGTVEGNLIPSAAFQWGSRYGGGTEVRGNGAIDALGVWTRVLTADELTAVARATEPAPVAVTFSDVPEGWGTMPTTAQLILADRPVNLETHPAARQTLGERAANVAVIDNNSGGSFDIYGIWSASYGDLSTLNRDVWLKVTGGTHNEVIGGANNDWRNNHANAVNGNLLTEVVGATVNQVVGGIAGCSTGGVDGDGLPFTGDTLVTIGEGAQVVGNIVGGNGMYHARTFTHTGNTTVRVRALQTRRGEGSTRLNNYLYGNHLIGGSVSADGSSRNNTHFTVTQTGDSTVEVVLPDDAAGTFAKEIIGGSYNAASDSDTYTFAIGGNVSVLIDAPEAVTFAYPIYAGTRGPQSSVGGKVTLTLRGGTFTSDILPYGDTPTITGGTELVLAGGERLIDLTQATVGAFDALTLEGGLVDIGLHRDLPITLRSGKVRVEVTAAEAEAGRVALGRADAVPEGLTIETKNMDCAHTLAVEDGTLYAVLDEARNKTWATPAEGSAWVDGFPGFQTGDNAFFGANDAEEPVTVTEDVAAQNVSVEGTYRLNTNGWLLSARKISVAAGGELAFGTSAIVCARWVQLVPQQRVAAEEGIEHSDGWALAEIGLFRNGEQVPWGEDVSIVASKAPTNGSGADSHSDDNLLDGDLSTKWFWSTEEALTTTMDCQITLDAGEGNVFAFDGYNLATADQNGRNPILWTLLTSNDGVSFTPVDVRSYTQEQGVAWAANAWLADGPFALQYATGAAVVEVVETVEVAGTLTGAGTVIGDAVFQAGATLRVGTAGGPTVTGNASGTVALSLDSVELTDATALRVLTVGSGEVAFTAIPEGYAVNRQGGSYYLVRDFATPISVTLGANAEWGTAGWADANGVPVALNIWPTLPTALSQAAVTATAPVTLTTNPYVTRVGSLTIGKSEHTLTLAGASGLTVEEALTVDGPLATDAATLSALPGAITLNAPMTFAVPAGQTLSLGTSAIAGEAAFVKRGVGTLAFPNSATVTAPIHLQEGTLAFSTDSSPAPYATIPDIVAEGGTTVTLQEAFIQLQDAEATITLRNDATFRIYNGNSWASRPIAPTFLIENDGAPENAAHIQGSSNGQFAAFTGALQGHGLLILDGGNANQYNIACPIRDDGEGTLTLRFADDNSLIHLTSEGTYTGGTEIASAVSIGTSGGTVSAKAAPDALGRGPIAIEAGGTLTIADNTTLNVHAAFSNAGTLTGAIRLCDGASLTGGATAAFDTVSVSEGATVTVSAPEGTEVGTKLVSWVTGPADATGFAVEGWKVEARTDGLYATEPSATAPTLPEAAEGDAGGATFNDIARALLAQAATAAGLSEVTAVSGVANGRPMTTEELNAALPILQGEGLITVEGTALRVAYDFTVTTLAVEGGNVSVTATLSAPNGGTVAFGPMAIKAELIPVSLSDETSGEGESLAEQTLTPATAEAPITALSFTVPADTGTRLFKVRVAPVMK